MPLQDIRLIIETGSQGECPSQIVRSVIAPVSRWAKGVFQVSYLQRFRRITQNLHNVHPDNGAWIVMFLQVILNGTTQLESFAAVHRGTWPAPLITGPSLDFHKDQDPVSLGYNIDLTTTGPIVSTQNPISPGLQVGRGSVLAPATHFQVLSLISSFSTKGGPAAWEP